MKQFNVLSFYQDYRISVAPDGHKHARFGWIQIPCPFCTGNPGYHLGFKEDKGYFNCWRCGFHSIKEVIKELLDCNWKKAKQVYDEYLERVGRVVDKAELVENRILLLPEGTAPLQKIHKKYLTSRGFESWVEELFDLKGTSYFGPYSHRIIAPIYYRGQLVSYQSRDYTGKTDMRWKACSDSHELLSHKTMVYGSDLVPTSVAIVVEGISDVWKIGPGAVATSGVEYKTEQVRFLAKHFSKLYVMFDNDSAGRRAGKSLRAELEFRGVETESIPVKSDPGDMEQEEIQELLNKYKILG